MQATIFGDSILKAVLYENGKYRMNMEPEREFSAESGIQIHNYARFGCTIRKAIRWIRRDCEESGKPEDSVVLEFGGNDCDYDWARISQNPVLRIQCKTPPEEFAALYREALALIRQSGRRPVAMTLPPIHSLRYLNFVCKNGLLKENLLRWLGDAGAIGRRQRLYSELALQVAREEQAEVIDLRAAFPQDETALAELLCEDGIHPNQKGQARILNEIRTACCRKNYQTAHRSL